MSKILITGSTGFIGGAIARQLGQEGRDIIAIGSNDLDLTHYGAVKQFLESNDIDTIFHFAAKQGKTRQAYEDNVRMTFNLLEHCKDETYFIYASSSTVYGNFAEIYQKEANEKDVTVPTSLYGASKLAGESIVQTYHNSGRINALILRYVANVGVNATHGVFPDILSKLSKDTNTLELFGNMPGSYKPYMHINDTVAMTLSLSNLLATGVYNVCPNDFISIKTLADVVMSNLNLSNQPELKWLGNGHVPTGDNRIVWLSNAKICSVLRPIEDFTSVYAIKRATIDYKNGRVK